MAPPPPPPCQLCKSRCASSLATGKLFDIYFQPSFRHAATVPCNVRLKFNKLTGDTMTFEAPGEPYTMEVEKGRNMSQIGGDEWARFLARMRLTGDDEDDEDDEDNEDPLDEDDEDPLHEAIVAQRMRLSEEEVRNLWDIIPPRDDFVGVPFVTRLTSTMVDRHDMKLPKSLSVSCGIEPDEEGSAGLCLTARGSFTTCTYRMDTDGRTHLNSVGWKRFLVGKNLPVGQAILITIRNTCRSGLRMMIVVNII
ncbi:hypothetical protein CFC21_050142 [Triticum aestivum]|uniref:TF-B3 domain-containing protein n=2 Tax=Triticum aestivum TaxID=4565 RepID=A0A3B6H5R9_WHEAT|nr:hypothetical protein CFC21_050142 [Triticum aestivum]